MRSRISTYIFALVVISVFLPPLYRGFTRDPSREFVMPAAPGGPEREEPAFYRETFVEDGLAPSQHCASVVELGNGDLLALWYGGTNEGEPDVALYQAVFNIRTGDWSKPRRLTTIAKTQEELGVYTRKLGNAVLLKGLDGRIWLFYVSVSVGGWSGAAVNYAVSDDDGLTWTRAKRLVTSPFFNMGTMVKGAPVLYRDGTIGLPTYHEMFGKFGELVHLGPDGSVLDKSLVSPDRTSLQPAVVPLSPTRALAFMRNSTDDERRIVWAETRDGGRTWIGRGKLPLPNPDAPVACIRARDGTLWLVFNNTEQDRDTLALARSADGGETWEEVHMFEDASGYGMEGFSYPFIIECDGGVFHLLYTYDRARIKHVTFNSFWLGRL